MTLKNAIEPHWRKNQSVRSVFSDVIIALCLILVLSVMYNGARAAVVVGFSVLICMLSETVFCLFQGKPVTLSDTTAVITGFIIAMLMPATVPFYVVAFADVFAICIAKMPFGGMGRNTFNPAAAGFSFAAVCFTGEVFKYRDTKIITHIPVFDEFDFTAVESPASQLARSVRPDIYPSEMALGNFPGPMGTTCVLVIAACCLYLLLRNTIKWQIPVFFIGAASLYALCFPRLVGSITDSVLFELLSGNLVFCAVFMATDPVTSPKTPWGRAIYGFAGGIMTMLFRDFGAFEQGACFALLILNSMSILIDNMVVRIKRMMEVH